MTPSPHIPPQVPLGPHPKLEHSLKVDFLEGCPLVGVPQWPPPGGGEGRTEWPWDLLRPFLREVTSRPTCSPFLISRTTSELFKPTQGGGLPWGKCTQREGERG